MKMENFYMPTLREAPREAEIDSYKLILRTGMARRLVSGIYTYLPLGLRVIRKVEDIVRDEMDKHGAQEMLMSAVQPREIWEATGRWDDFGPEMFKLRDRNDREFCLGPTHEEYLTETIKGEIRSYKQLPINLYQIQTKYRDEKRPRFGFMRAREFIMKDAYSFDKDLASMDKSYENMRDCYNAIFTRLGFDYRPVSADSGAMGGSASEEFMVISDTGESGIVYCNKCNYAASDEKAEVLYEIEDKSEKLEMEKIHTPKLKTIEDLAEFFKLSPSKFAKALVYNFKGEPIVVIIPGDRELNEIKLFNYLGAQEHEIEMASDFMIEEITGAEVGFTGPVDLKKDVKIYIDSRVSKMKNMIVGANESDYHIKNVNYPRDFDGELVDDLLMIEKTDLCPNCGGKLEMERGIEVGHIFQLGDKYSKDLGASFLDENGRDSYLQMGCYGIGISRVVAALIEQNNDEKGMIWPMNTAPYQAIITVINIKNEEQKELGEKLYEEMRSKGIEVILDNRDERAGVKFNDRDLIGIPLRITVGRGISEGLLEFSTRYEMENTDVKIEEVVEKTLEEINKRL